MDGKIEVIQQDNKGPRFEFPRPRQDDGVAELIAVAVEAYVRLWWWSAKFLFAIIMITLIFLLTQGVIDNGSFDWTKAHMPSATELLLAFVAFVLVMKNNKPTVNIDRSKSE